MNRQSSAYTYDVRSGRYRSRATGRWVSAQTVRAELDKSIEASARAVREASNAVREGRMSLSAWQLKMAEEIRNSQLSATALAKGGWQNLSRSDEQRAARAIRAQYEYLRQFVADVASGKQKLDGTFTRRAELYINASRGQYEETRRREMELRGNREERRLRHAKDSCADCVSAAAMGWQPIGTLPKIGESQCLSRCRCTFDYRENAAAEAA